MKAGAGANPAFFRLPFFAQRGTLRQLMPLIQQNKGMIMEELVRVKMPKTSREMLREIAARLKMTQQDAAALLIKVYYQDVFSTKEVREKLKINR